MANIDIPGKYLPWAWAVEPVRGCNLRCGHCTTRLWPPKQYTFMQMDTWCNICAIINKTKPKCRVEMANAGEPTLHPDLYKMLSRARKLAPQAQLQITTNGTQLMSGAVTYKELFRAGANIVYVDMYAANKKHIALAKESGYYFYEYNNKPPNAPGAWCYHDDPRIKFIVLMTPPIKWPDKRKSLQRLGTFCNSLDWEADKEFDLVPVTDPPARRCSQLMKYIATNTHGDYMMCCQDLANETVPIINHNVSEGVDGFLLFWFGKQMMEWRRLLHFKQRTKISQCSRCSVIFNKCDMIFWGEELHNNYWTGTGWARLPSIV